MWKKYFLSLLLTATFSTQVLCALPADIEMDRYLLAAKTHIENQNYDAAEDYLKRIKSLKATTPAVYYYYLGTVQEHKQEYRDAKENLSTYVEKTGKEGEFYEDALLLITQAEENLSKSNSMKKQEEEVKTNQAEMIKAISSGFTNEGKVYDKKIRSLYLTDSTIKALTSHINALLQSSLYTGTRVRSITADHGVKYTVSTTSSGDIVVTKQDFLNRVNGNATVSSTQTPVFGKDFFISYACSQDSFSCWIKHPDGSGKWVEISYDESTAKELAKAFSRLIKNIQNQ